MVFGWGRKKGGVQNAGRYGWSGGSASRNPAGEPAAGAASPAPDTRTVSTGDIRSILDAATAEQSSALVGQIRRIRGPVTDHIAALLAIAVDLERDELDTDDIDTNIATIVRRGKKQVLDIINKESKKRLPEINSVGDARQFHRLASQTLAKIGDILGKQTRVIHIFAKKYAGRLKEILARFKDDMERSGRLLDGYALFERERDSASGLLDTLSAEAESARAISGKVASLRESVGTSRALLGSLEDSIRRFQESPVYAKHTEIRGMLGLLGEKKARIEKQINGRTILISRPVSKYGYASSLDREGRALVSKFLSSPFEVFLPENRPAVAGILENIKKEISLGHLSVKEPQKVAGHIDDIIAAVDGFVESVGSVLAEQGRLQAQLKDLDVGELDGYKRRQEKARQDIEFSESRAAELEAEAAALASRRPAHVAELESALNRMAAGGPTRYAVADGGP